MIKLGDKVKDKISGLVGIATQKTEYLNGCVQFGVQPKLNKKDNEITTWNIDEAQLEVVGKPKIVKKKNVGGPTMKIQ